MLLESEACVAITQVDGLVLARSAFNHSMNYRSGVVPGRFEAVPPEQKVESLHRLMDHIAPGRRHEARPGDASELAATGMQQVFVLHMVCDALAALRMWDAEGFALALELCLPLRLPPSLAAQIDGLLAQAGVSPPRLVLLDSEVSGCCEVSDLLDWLHVREAGCAHAAGDFIVAPQPMQVLPAALRRWQASYSAMSAADAFN